MRATHFVESYFDAWNHRDPQAVADHLVANGIYRDIPENVERSQDELIANLHGFFSDYRHRYRLIGELITGRNTIAFQYEAFSSELNGREGFPIRYRGAEFVTLQGDAAITITDYYDYPGISPVSKRKGVRPRVCRGQKYAKSGLSEDQQLAYSRQLEDIMQSQQTFLRPDLTLPKLAQEIGCSGNHLSQVINSEFGTSFFEYLNQYRIDYAKELLSLNNGQSTSILNIAFTVGFNSNSAFYSAFKKRVGITPAQYRQRQLNRRH